MFGKVNRREFIIEDYIIVNEEKAYKYILNDNYFITKSGKLYSIFVKGGQGKVDINKPRLVAYGQDRDGYYRVVLSDHGKHTRIKIHQIMANQFLGGTPDGMVINHIDGNKHNNSVDNLEIITNLENIQHAWKNKLINKENNPNRIHVDVYDNYTNDLFHVTSLHDVYVRFGLPLRYIRYVMDNEIGEYYCYFKKVITGDEISDYRIDVFYNGKILKSFDSYKSAGEYFHRKPNTIVYRCLDGNKTSYKVNRYTLTFPNVSTIENVA